MNSRICSIRVSSVATLIPLLTLAVMAPSAPAQVKGVVIVISTPTGWWWNSAGGQASRPTSFKITQPIHGKGHLITEW